MHHFLDPKRNASLFFYRDTLPCISQNDFTFHKVKAHGYVYIDGRMVREGEYILYVKKKETKRKENKCWLLLVVSFDITKTMYTMISLLIPSLRWGEGKRGVESCQSLA